MIKTQLGNILDATEKVICHSVNHQGVMGAGLAGQIAKKYPAILNEHGTYKVMCRNFAFAEIRTQGLIAWYDTWDNHIIASLFGQEYYGRSENQYTDIESFKNGMTTIKRFCENKKYDLAIPFGIGCGLGGGDWSVIFEIIESHFSNSPITATLYKLGK